jgi:hypothetical protein
MGPDLTVEEKREAYHLFHKVWGAAGAGQYEKADWNRLQILLERIIYVPPDKIWPTQLINDHSSSIR